MEGPVPSLAMSKIARRAKPASLHTVTSAEEDVRVRLVTSPSEPFSEPFIDDPRQLPPHEDQALLSAFAAHSEGSSHQVYIGDLEANEFSEAHSSIQEREHHRVIPKAFE